jgi:hypothetical protein
VRGRKRFFFEKKQQKTFGLLGVVAASLVQMAAGWGDSGLLRRARNDGGRVSGCAGCTRSKSFLVVFFKKERLASFEVLPCRL